MVSLVGNNELNASEFYIIILTPKHRNLFHIVDTMAADVLATPVLCLAIHIQVLSKQFILQCVKEDFEACKRFIHSSCKHIVMA